MADKHKGWILLYRSLRDSWLWDIKPFSHGQAWIDLILDVNHQDKKTYINGKLIKIKRGQTWTSLRVLGERWGWRQEKVLRFLQALERDTMITRNATRNGTLLTVVNYGDFQDMRSTERSTNGAQTATRPEHERSETKNDKRINKRIKRKEALPTEEKPVDDDDLTWFDKLEDENDSTKH